MKKIHLPNIFIQRKILYFKDLSGFYLRKENFTLEDLIQLLYGSKSLEFLKTFNRVVPEEVEEEVLSIKRYPILVIRKEFI